LKLSTASFLSARFPFISPTGKMGKGYHFLDGGLKENSGSETSGEIGVVFKRALDKLQREDTVWKSCSIRFCYLSLPNSVFSDAEELEVKNMFELTAPLTALMNNRVGNTTKAEAILEKMPGAEVFTIRPELIDSTKPIAVLPLGWQISNIALDQMRASVDSSRAYKKILRIFQH
jgi:hypothetical protein